MFFKKAKSTELVSPKNPYEAVLEEKKGELRRQAEIVTAAAQQVSRALQVKSLFPPEQVPEELEKRFCRERNTLLGEVEEYTKARQATLDFFKENINHFPNVDNTYLVGMPDISTVLMRVF